MITKNNASLMSDFNFQRLDEGLYDRSFLG
jgi:hypothetical protein